MRKPLLWILIAIALFATGWFGGRISLAAAEPKNFDLDAAEMDRTQEVLVGHVRTMNEKLKAIAHAVTADKLDDPNKERDKQIGKTLEPLTQDAFVLFIQTFLLALDNAIDTGGAPTEGAILGYLSKQLDVPIKDLTARREKSQLGLGGVFLGYAISKAAKVAPDEIFANKADNKSWPELMRARQVTLAQLQEILEKK
jgi:hypothetical protein